jgi:iron-sulfur cluster assembly protein
MFKLTQRAAQQVLQAAKDSDMEGLALRVAARTKPDGGIDYGIGFDEVHADDIRTSSHGVEVLIAPAYQDLLAAAVMDYVEMEPGQFHFVFMNPNDPHYVPPTEPEET